MIHDPKLPQLSSEDFEIKKKRRILLLDIETSPTISAVWSKYQADTVWEVEGWYMLSWSAKWLEGKQTTRGLIDYDDYDPDKKCDKRLVTELWELMNTAEICVAHNGIKFDFKKCKARFIKNGLNPVLPFLPVDTLSMAKRNFGFFSNRLNDIGKFLDLGEKVETGGYKLWEQCMKGDPKAWNRMKRYNAQDVKLLEAVYLKMRAWDRPHPNMNVFDGTDGCPKCGSLSLRQRGYAYSTLGKAKRFQCKDCGGYSQDKYVKQAEIR